MQQARDTRNTCQQCGQRIVRPDGRVLVKALDVRQGVLWLQCRCGHWNRAPARLAERLRSLVGMAAPS
jgi:hypothetical protein